MAQDAKLGDETVSFFDERYPGKMVELSAMLFGEKSFIMSDYIRNFINTELRWLIWGRPFLWVEGPISFLRGTGCWRSASSVQMTRGEGV